MIDQVEMLTADKSQSESLQDVQNVIKALPLQQQEDRRFLLNATDELADPTAGPRNATQQIKVWMGYGAAILIAGLCAMLLMWMMGK